MIVEFTGCSGAGKTVVIKCAYDILKKTVHPVFTPLDIMLGKSMAGGIHSERSQNAILDLVALPYFVFKIHEFFPFFLFCLKIIKANADSLIKTMLLTRSVIRKLGLYKFLSQRKFEKKIILVDEGTFHIAHIIFINGRGLFTDTAIHKFEQIVLRPDLIVFVQAPLQSIIERTEQRANKPIRSVDSQQLKRFVMRAHHLFERLIKNNRYKNEVLVIKTSGDMQDTISISAKKVVDKIADAIR